MWISKKEWQALQQRLYQAKVDCWEAASEVIDLKIDIDNLQRKVTQLQKKSASHQGKS
jgi:hypothetical protein